MFDFWQGKLKVNFNRCNEPSGGIQAAENGFVEDYFFPISTAVNTVRTQFRNLIAARCALFSSGMYVFGAKFSQASIYKDAYDLNGCPTLPVPDNAETGNAIVGPCGTIDDGPQFRFEDGLGRRWNRIIRGVREAWFGDMNFSPGAWVYDPASALASPQVPLANPGVQATATAAVTAGAVTGFTVVGGGSGYTYTPPVIIVGVGTGATATATMVGGVITAVTLGMGGTGYTTAPTVIIPPPQYEAWALVPFQTPSVYLANYLSCLVNYTINFRSVRVGNGAFPSGMMTQGDTNPTGGGPYTIARILLQKMADRQTGRINIRSKARRKSYV